MAEALTVRTAITFAISCGIESAILFSNSQSLISLINKKTMKLEIFNILRDISLLVFSFKSISFNHISKLDNDLADSIAKQVLWALDPA